MPMSSIQAQVPASDQDCGFYETAPTESLRDMTAKRTECKPGPFRSHRWASELRGPAQSAPTTDSDERQHGPENAHDCHRCSSAVTASADRARHRAGTGVRRLLGWFAVEDPDIGPLPGPNDDV